MRANRISNRSTRDLAAALIPLLVAGTVACGRGDGKAAEADPAGAVAVHVGTIVRTDLRSRVVAYGTIEPEPATPQHPAAAATVSPVVSGVVTGVHCTEGRPVTQGQILFELDPRAANQAIVQAEQAVAFAEQELARQEKMRPGDGTSIRRYQEAQRNLEARRAELALSRTQRSYLDVASPLSGRVVRVLTRVGEAAGPGVPLAEVIDLDRLVAIVRVPESELGALRVGQAVMLGEIPGSLRFIGARVDPRSGTVPAWVTFPSGAGLLPGRFVEAHIVTEEHTGCLAVPREAVIPDENGQDSVVVVQDGKARRVAVTTGLLDGGAIEVEGEGLVPQAVVVTSGGAGLIDGDAVTVLGRSAGQKGAS